MPKKPEAQSFEVAEYSTPELDTGSAYRVIKQIFNDVQRTQAQFAVGADWTGDLLKIKYHSYEMFLPERIGEIEQRADEVFKMTVKMLKQEFKERTGATLSLKEKKDMGDSAREKVSLNQRFYYKAWRFYEISF